jgi:hypothetical protein
MKYLTTRRASLTLALVIAMAVPSAWAQMQKGPGKGMPKYDPATEVTVKGTVKEVKEFTSPRGRTGTHLTLNTSAETFDVRLGPSAFLAEKEFVLAGGDEIEVTGSKISYGGAAALLARTVKKANKTLTLRNAEGIPQWAKGWRR